MEKDVPLRSLEFTPIGYVKEKQNGKRRIDESPSSNRGDGVAAVNVRGSKVRRTSFDDTVHSMRMFEESVQFDDTLPELERKKIVNGVKKNLVGELEDNAATSNPLKEQQDELQKLRSENYNLKLKYGSLLKIMNNITDSGELKRSVEILDEIEQWKMKFSSKNQEYASLLAKVQELEQKLKNSENVVRETSDQEIESTKHLKDQLSKLQEQLSKSEDVVREKNYQIELNNDDIKLKDEQIEDIKHQWDELKRSLEDKDDRINSLEKENAGHKARANIDNDEKFTNELRQRSDKIEELQQNLDRVNTEKMELEKKMNAKDNELDKLNRDLQNQRSLLSHNASSSTDKNTQLRTRISDLEIEKKSLESKISILESENKDLEKSLSRVKFELRSLEEDRDKDKKLHESALHELQKDKELKLKSQQTENDQTIKSLREEIEQLSSALDAQKQQLSRSDSKLESTLMNKLRDTEINLEKSQALAEELKLQLVENTTKTTERISLRVTEKEKEISNLKRQLEESSNYLKDKDEKINDLTNEFESEKRKLQRRVSSLQNEKDQLLSSQNEDIDIMKMKCKRLEEENKTISKRNEELISSLSNKVSEKSQEIRQTMDKHRNLEIEYAKLTENYNKLKLSNDEYKSELQKTVSDLEAITKKLQYSKTDSKIKNVSNIEHEYDLIETQKTLQRLQLKYNSMKKDYLLRLTALQDENLALEKRLSTLNARSSSSSNRSFNTNDKESFLQRDRADYYRLRYHNEVKQNNDLKVMNEYLNRVMRAASRQLRLDLLKLRNEMDHNPRFSDDILNNHLFERNFFDGGHLDQNQFGQNIYGNYNKSFVNRKRFKAIALVVLACVRMKTTALKHKWDEQRINYLQKKIALDQDRITW